MGYNIARVVAGAFFLYAGVMKIFGFSGVVGWIGSVGYPYPEVLAAAAVLLEVVAGAALIANRYVSLASYALAAFTVLAGAMFHQFWAAAPELAANETNHFLKNVVIAAGLLLIGQSSERK